MYSDNVDNLTSAQYTALDNLKGYHDITIKAADSCHNTCYEKMCFDILGNTNFTELYHLL